MKKTIQQFAQEIRAQYPNMYDSIDDVSLVALILQNAPQVAQTIDFGNPVPPQLIQYAGGFDYQQPQFQNPTNFNQHQQNPHFQNNYNHPQPQASPSKSNNFMGIPLWAVAVGIIAVGALCYLFFKKKHHNNYSTEGRVILVPNKIADSTKAVDSAYNPAIMDSSAQIIDSAAPVSKYNDAHDAAVNATNAAAAQTGLQ